MRGQNEQPADIIAFQRNRTHRVPLGIATEEHGAGLDIAGYMVFAVVFKEKCNSALGVIMGICISMVVFVILYTVSASGSAAFSIHMI